ncbi:MAG: hypothetical protein ACREJ4_01150 [Candidatus Methylomirabilaceae bacterium]
MTISGHAHLTSKRPRSVTVIGYLIVAAGIIGFAYHATEFSRQGPVEYGVVWVLLIRLLAIVGGVLMLRGANWARWLALAWIAYHVILSALHSWSDTVIHVGLLAGVAYVLLRPEASAYFRHTRRHHDPPAA